MSGRIVCQRYIESFLENLSLKNFENRFTFAYDQKSKRLFLIGTPCRYKSATFSFLVKEAYLLMFWPAVSSNFT